MNLAAGSHLLAAVVGIHLFVVVLRAIEVQPWSLAGCGVAVVSLIAAAVAGTRSRLGVGKLSPSRLRLAIVAVFFASRLLWVLIVSPEPISDFAGYHWIANAVGRGKRIYMPWPFGASVASWGYPVALGLVFRLVSGAIPELLVARLFNVTLGTGALLLLGRVVRRISGVWPALVAMALFTLWPAQLYLTAILATENLAVPALLLAVVVALRILDTSRSEPAQLLDAARSAILGLVFAGCITVRAALIGVVPAFLLVLLRWRRPPRCGVAAALVTLAFVLLGVCSFPRILERTYQGAPLSAVWWSLLTGMSFESSGSLSRTDQERFFAHATIDEANAFARDEILRRLRSDPAGLLHLAYVKTVNLWLADDYAVFWVIERGPPWLARTRDAMAAAAQTFHLAILVLAILGCVLLARSPPAPGTELIVLAIACGTLLHAVSESQARYHFVLEPMVMTLASIGLCALFQRFRGASS